MNPTRRTARGVAGASQNESVAVFESLKAIRPFGRHSRIMPSVGPQQSKANRRVSCGNCPREPSQAR
jgi:hypothetical protein